MGQIATLGEILRSLPQLDPAQTIYASEPWTEESAAVVDHGPPGRGVPESAASGGLAYFLEVSIAQDVAEDWQGYKGGEASEAELCDRVIYYALNDA